MSKHRVCREPDLSIGEKVAFQAGEEKMIVYRLEDGFYATQATCTHLFMPLSLGKIVDDCKIQCPFHRAQFDIKTGEVCEWANFPPGIQLLNAVRAEKALKTYPVSVENGDVVVEV